MRRTFLLLIAYTLGHLSHIPIHTRTPSGTAALNPHSRERPQINGQVPDETVLLHPLCSPQQLSHQGCPPVHPQPTSIPHLAPHSQDTLSKTPLHLPSLAVPSRCQAMAAEQMMNKAQKDMGLSRSYLDDLLQDLRAVKATQAPPLLSDDTAGQSPLSGRRPYRLLRGSAHRRIPGKASAGLSTLNSLYMLQFCADGVRMLRLFTSNQGAPCSS